MGNITKTLPRTHKSSVYNHLQPPSNPDWMHKPISTPTADVPIQSPTTKQIWFEYEEVALRLGVSYSTIKRLVLAGQLGVPIPVGPGDRYMRIHINDVERYEKQQREKGKAMLTARQTKAESKRLLNGR